MTHSFSPLEKKNSLNKIEPTHCHGSDINPNIPPLLNLNFSKKRPLDSNPSSTTTTMEEQSTNVSNNSSSPMVVPSSQFKKKIKVQLPSLPSIGPHPWGILPLGNLLVDRISPSFINTRSQGLGYFALFEDSFLLAFIVEYLNPNLLTLLAQVSKVWCSFAYYEEIWKGWVLAKYQPPCKKETKKKVHLPTTENHSITCSTPFRWVKGSWRLTYIALVTNSSTIHASKLQLQIPYFYSDLLYHPHYYSQIPVSYLINMLNNASSFTSKLPMCSNLSLKDFHLHYEQPNLPCILQKALSNWSFPIPFCWSDLQDLVKETLLQAEAIQLTFQEYFQYLSFPCSTEEVPVYLFDHSILHSKAFQSKFCIPKYFKSDLFSYLGIQRRPHHAWLIVGPEKSGSTHHKDPNATSAWNAVLKGSKLWILYPPDFIPPGVFPSANQANVHTPISLMDWWINWFPQTAKYIQQHKVNPISNTTNSKVMYPQWGICKEGEVVFVPSGWWHTVINLEPSIAITQNYVSVYNLEKVLYFLDHHRDMVSGYQEEDKEEKLINNQPSTCPSSSLYEDFVHTLRTSSHVPQDVLDIVEKYELHRKIKKKSTHSSLSSLFQASDKQFSLFEN